jgi:hypothetical protein
MANEIPFGWETGASLKAKVWQSDGSYRLSDITLTETQTGLYLGDCGTIIPGDNVIVMDTSTSDVKGHGVYDYRNSKTISDTEAIISDIVVADAVVDNIYSDTTLIANTTSDIYSDTATIISDMAVADAIIDNIYSDTTHIANVVSDIYSDTATAISDIAIADSGLTAVLSNLSDIFLLDDIYSDTTSINSELAIVLEEVRKTVHEFNLGEL